MKIDRLSAACLVAWMVALTILGYRQSSDLRALERQLQDARTVFGRQPLTRSQGAIGSNQVQGRLPELVEFADAVTKGSTEADVAVLEYSDYQCPYCATFARESFPVIDRQYIKTGRVLWAFQHLPLERIHALALDAAVAASCAAPAGTILGDAQLSLRQPAPPAEPGF